MNQVEEKIYLVKYPSSLDDRNYIAYGTYFRGPTVESVYQNQDSAYMQKGETCSSEPDKWRCQGSGGPRERVGS